MGGVSHGEGGVDGGVPAVGCAGDAGVIVGVRAGAGVCELHAELARPGLGARGENLFL